MYWGGFIHKTWDKLTRLEQLKRWEDKTIDLTWFCVPCYRQFKNLPSDHDAANELKVYRNVKHRKDQTTKWRGGDAKKGNKYK